MRGKLAGDAEVAGGAHQAVAEDLLPEAVDHDAGGQRMLGPDQPLRQAEPVLGQVGRHGGKGVGRIRLDRVAALVVLAAVEQVRHRRLGSLVHHVRVRTAFLDGGVFRLEGRQLLAELPRIRVEHAAPPGEDVDPARPAAACRPALARARRLGRAGEYPGLAPVRGPGRRCAGCERPTGRFATRCAAARP